MSWEMIALAGAWYAVAGGAYLGARMTLPDRNYHPLLRVIWTAFAVLGMLAGTGVVLARSNTITSRLTFVAIMLVAIGYSLYFMRQRNRTPRYVPLNIGGQTVFVDIEHLRRQADNVTSFIKHGSAPEAWVKGIEEACVEWRQLERWRKDTEAEVQRRKRRTTGADERPANDTEGTR